MSCEKTKELAVAEGIRGTFFYHLWHPGDRFALCGKHVMRTSIPVSAWGVKTHLNEHWCATCKLLADRDGR